MAVVSQFLSEFSSGSDIAILGSLVTTNKQENDFHSSLAEVDPVSRAIIDSQF